MDAPEKFILTSQKVPGFDFRVKAAWFLMNGHEDIKDLEEKLNIIIEFFKGIVKDKRLKIFMKYMLAMCNYINGPKKRWGGKWGFIFDSLLFATNTKTVTTKMGIVQLMIDMIEDGGKKGSIIDPEEEFPDLDFVQKYDIP